MQIQEYLHTLYFKNFCSKNNYALIKRCVECFEILFPRKRQGKHTLHRNGLQRTIVLCIAVPLIAIQFAIVISDCSHYLGCT